MYPDPSNVRRNIVKICLNDHEAAILDLASNLTGEQKQVLARKMYAAGMKSLEALIQQEESNAKSA